MAYFVRSKRFGPDSTLGTTITGDLPTHETGDLLVAIVSAYSAGRTVTETSGLGWTVGVTTNTACTIVVLYKFAASSSESAPTFTASAVSYLHGNFLVIKGAHTTSTIQQTAHANSTTNGTTMPSVTTTEDNVLMLGITQCFNHREGTLFDPSVRQLFTEHNSLGSVAAYIHPQLVAGATPTPGFIQVDAQTVERLVVGIRDDGTTGMAGAQQPNERPADLVHALWNVNFGYGSGPLNDGTEIASNPTTIIPSIDGFTSQSIGTSVSTFAEFRKSRDFPLNMGFNHGGGSQRDVPCMLATLFAASHPLYNSSGLDLEDVILSYRITLGKPIMNNYAVGGNYMCLISGNLSTGSASIFKTEANDTVVKSTQGIFPYVFYTGQTPHETGVNGAADLANVSRIAIATNQDEAGIPIYGYLYKLNTFKIVGGSSVIPANFQNAADYVQSNSVFSIQTQSGQASGQFYIHQNMQVGSGSTTYPVYFDSANQSVAFPAAYDLANLFVHANIPQSLLSLTVYGASGDTIKLRNATVNFGDKHNFVIHASTSASATYDFSGLVVINATVTLNDVGAPITGVTFSSCGEITKNGADLSGGCTLNATTAAQSITVTGATEAALQAILDDLANCTFTNNPVAIRIAFTGTGDISLDFSGMSFSGNTTDIHFNSTNASTLTANMQNGSDASTSAISGAAVAVTIVSASALTVTSNIAASDIKIFETGTQTIEAQATGTSASTTVAGTYDITVMKSGYLPQRRTGVVLGSSSVSVDITLVEDPVYNASHGLTYTTDFAYNRTTRVLTIVAAQQGRSVYSALIDAFIAQSTLDNTEFPIFAVGIDRFDFTSDGTTASTIDSGDIQFWRGAGMEWEHATTGNKTHKFCSIVGTGTNASGTKGYYQQVNGSAPTALTLVSNNVNQVIQYYSDTNGDGTPNYDYDDHLVIKLFNDGYYQASQDVLVAYGLSALESFEYVLPLQMESTGLGTGDRGITITVTDDTATPVEQQTAYFFDYKIEGGAADSPEDLLRQWIYDVFTDPTASDYSSKINFNWCDPIIESGGNYETRRGIVYGEGTTTSLHGFYVEEGSAYHPDFLRQQSNDGTYFITPIVASASVTGMPTAGAVIRLQVINETGRTASAWQASTAYVLGDKVRRTTGIGTESNAGLYFVCTTAGTSGGTEPTWSTTPGNTTADGTAVWTTRAVQKYSNNPSSSAYSATYTDGTEYSSGDTVRVRFTEMNGATSFKTFAQNVVASSSGWAVACDEIADTVYADNAVNGTTITKFTADYVADEIDLVVAANFTSAEMYAFYCFALTSADGIHDFWGGVTAIDAGNYRINTATLNVYFDNETTATQRQTDTARIFRDDEVYPVKDPTTSGFGIDINWKNVVYVQIVSGASVVTSQDKADIADLVAIDLTVVNENVKDASLGIPADRNL